MAVAPGAEKSNSSFRPSIQHRLDRSEAKQASYSTWARWYKLGSSFVLFFSEHSQVAQRSPRSTLHSILQTCGRRADGSPLTGMSQIGQASLLAALNPPSAHSAHWLPSRRIASIAIIAQYPLPHCHDYGLALSCLALPCLALPWPVW